MKVITDVKEVEEYSIFMSKVSYTIFKDSKNALEELGVLEEDSKIEDLAKVTEAVGLSVGQSVHDRVIELTEDWPKEKLIKYLAQLAGVSATEHMNSDAGYRMNIMMFGKLIDGM